VNADMAHYTHDGKFHSLFAAYFEKKTARFTYASSGSKTPVLLRDGQAEFLSECPGPPLGFDMEKRYQERGHSLIPGDRIFLYSDALVEIFEEKRGLFLFNENDLLGLLRKNISLACGDLLDSVLESLTVTTGELPLKDDLTMILFRFSEMASGSFESAEIDSLLKEGEEKILLAMSERDWTRNEIEELSLAYGEIILNAVHHGNQDDPAKKVAVSFEVDAETVKVRVADEGPGFSPAIVPDPAELALLVSRTDGEGLEKLFHGRGIWMSRNIFLDDLVYNERGNQATLTKKKRPNRTRMFQK